MSGMPYDTPRPDHTCPRHPAGTRACYNKDGCRCRACLDATNTYRRHQHHGTTTRIPAQPILDHLARLYASGMIRRDVELASGVHESTLRSIEDGTVSHVNRPTARAILTTRPTIGDRVPGSGAARRLRALAALGWTAVLLEQHTGLTCIRLRDLRKQNTARISTADHRAIADAYDRLWNQTPPYTKYTEAVRRRAERRGWPPPMAWDDDPTSPHGIDNPAATPAAAGLGRKRDRDAAQLAEVEYLLGCGVPAHQVADQLGYKDPASLSTWLRRHGRDDLANPFGRKAAA